MSTLLYWDLLICIHWKVLLLFVCTRLVVTLPENVSYWDRFDALCMVQVFDTTTHTHTQLRQRHREKGVVSWAYNIKSVKPIYFKRYCPNSKFGNVCMFSFLVAKTLVWKVWIFMQKKFLYKVCKKNLESNTCVLKKN